MVILLPIQVATTLLFPLLSYQFEPCAPGMPRLLQGQSNAGEIPARRRTAQTRLRQALRAATSFDSINGKSEPTRLKVEPDAFRKVLDHQCDGKSHADD